MKKIHLPYVLYCTPPGNLNPNYRDIDQAPISNTQLPGTKQFSNLQFPVPFPMVSAALWRSTSYTYPVDGISEFVISTEVGPIISLYVFWPLGDMLCVITVVSDIRPEFLVEILDCGKEKGGRGGE